MNSPTQQIIAAINTSHMRSERKKALTHYLEKEGITKDFFELLEKNIMEEARGRKESFLKAQEEWKKIYTATLQELDAEEKENDKLLSERLAAVDPWDTNTKLSVFQKYSTQQTVLYQAYQKKIAQVGAQYAKEVLKRISLN